MSDGRTLLPVAQAAHATGVGERRIRRWIAGGRLPAVDSPLGKLIDPDAVRHLASDTVRQTDTQASDSRTIPPDVSDTVRYVTDPALLALVDRITRESLELAGRVGWLQSENQRLGEQVRLLSAPASGNGYQIDPTIQVGESPATSQIAKSETAHRSPEGLNGQDSAVQPVQMGPIGPDASDPAPEARQGPPEGQISRVAGAAVNDTADPGSANDPKAGRPWWRRIGRWIGQPA